MRRAWRDGARTWRFPWLSLGACDAAGGGGLDGNPPGPADLALQHALGLRIGDGDDVAHRAGLAGPAAERDQQPRRLVDDGDEVALGDDLLALDVAAAQRHAGEQSPARDLVDGGAGVADDLAALPIARAALDDDVVLAERLAAGDQPLRHDDLDSLDELAGDAQRLQPHRHAAGHRKPGLKTARAGIEGEVEDADVARELGLDRDGR